MLVAVIAVKDFGSMIELVCSLVQSKYSQFESGALAEVDGVTERMIGLCLSLYSRGETEKLRLKALVKEACDS